MTTAGPSPIWRITVLHQTLAGARGEAIAVSWLDLPGWLERSDTIDDAEAALGEDWSARLVQLLLPTDRRWFWWTEAASLAGLARGATAVRSSRRLPESWPPSDGTIWVGRGLLRRWGAAIVPPDPIIQASLLENGPSQYSEFDPNFLLCLRPSPAASPAALGRWCREARPAQLPLDLLVDTAERVIMQWNGDVGCGLLREGEEELLAAVKAWAEARGVRVERG